MGYRLLNSTDTVQIFGPTFVQDSLACTIATTPHGAVVIRTIPLADFQADMGAGLLTSLADAVENILGEGIAIAAQGVQGVDDAGLLYDAVRFTVGYTPPGGTPGEITADVDIPVNTLTADTGILGGGFSGQSAPEIILNTYNRLRNMAGG